MTSQKLLKVDLRKTREFEEIQNGSCIWVICCGVVVFYDTLLVYRLKLLYQTVKRCSNQDTHMFWKILRNMFWINFANSINGLEQHEVFWALWFKTRKLYPERRNNLNILGQSDEINRVLTKRYIKEKNEGESYWTTFYQIEKISVRLCEISSNFFM